jgi:hypothetical protein
MLEVHSPVPLTEGETLIWGISTKHVLHFFIGLAVSSPITIVGFLILPLFGAPSWVSAIIGIGIGFMFAALPYQDRPIAEELWLTVRFQARPKIVLFDRAYRVRVHRKSAEQERRNTDD